LLRCVASRASWCGLAALVRRWEETEAAVPVYAAWTAEKDGHVFPCCVEIGRLAEFAQVLKGGR
jgi:hypothetical protein